MSSAGYLFNLQEREDEGKRTDEVSFDFAKENECDLTEAVFISK